MADDDSGEGDRAEEGEGYYGEGGVILGETVKKGSSSRGSLRSDFCKPEYEESPEEQGEGYWVCAEDEGEGRYFEGLWGHEEVTGEGEEAEEVTAQEKRSLDSQYLKSVLGTPLTFALLDIATKRPTDPIQYLAHYLLRWRWCGEEKTQYEEAMVELNRERELYLQRQRELERQEMLEKEEREEELRRAEREESSLEDEDLGEGHDLVVEG